MFGLLAGVIGLLIVETLSLLLRPRIARLKEARKSLRNLQAWDRVIRTLKFDLDSSHDGMCNALRFDRQGKTEKIDLVVFHNHDHTYQFYVKTNDNGDVNGVVDETVFEQLGRFAAIEYISRNKQSLFAIVD